MYLKDLCIYEGKLYLIDEWGTEKNLPLTPEYVSYGFHISVWWKCKWESDASIFE